jgi:hypothetical protein
MWTFQLGRVFGYALLGGVAAASMQGLGWLTTQSAAMRPVWTLFHVAAAVLGLLLLFNARQPVWLESAGKAIWHRARLGERAQGRRAAADRHGLGPAAVRPAVFRPAGRHAERQRAAGRDGHGPVRAGHQRVDDGRPLAVAAAARRGLGPVGRAPGRAGAGGDVRLGDLDGPGARHGALVCHA